MKVCVLRNSTGQVGPRALPPTGCLGLSDLQPNASVLLCMGGFSGAEPA